MVARSFPETAGVEETGVDDAAVVVVDVAVAVEVVAEADDVAGAEEVAVALVVVTTGDELVVVLLPFPPHPMKSVATITRDREIPNTFFTFHPPSPVFGFPAGSFGAPESIHSNTLEDKVNKT